MGRRKPDRWLIGGAAILVAACTGLGLYLQANDTSFGGFLSGVLLNFYGGEQNQLIRVNLHNKSLALYESGNLFKLDHIAAGGPPGTQYATHTGHFRILSKDKWHISTYHVIMPLSLRFDGPRYFHDIPLHMDRTPYTTEYSHGCIRLPHAMAMTLFDWANIGAYVEVYDASLARADDGSQTVYLLTADGYRQPIATAAAFLAHGYHWGDVVTIPAQELNGLPIGPAIQ